MLSKPLLLLLLFSLLSVSSQTIISALFNLAENDSIVILDTIGGIISSDEQHEASVYTNVVIDPFQRRALFLGVSDESWIDIYDVDSLSVIGDPVIIDYPYAFEDLQFDTRANKVLGITGDDQGFCLAEIFLNNGSVNVLLSLPGIQAMAETAAAFDVNRRIYYIPATTNNGDEWWAIDVAKKQVTRKYPVKLKDSNFDNVAYFPLNNWLVGMVNTTTFASLDLNTGEFKGYDQLNLEAIGFRELSGGVIDGDSGYYYSLFENEKAETTWIQIDINHLSYTSYRFFNHVSCMAFVPEIGRAHV